jgi:hypothetical protein
VAGVYTQPAAVAFFFIYPNNISFHRHFLLVLLTRL